MPHIDDAISVAVGNEYALHLIRLSRIEANARAKILRLLSELQRDLVGQLASIELTELKRARLQQLLREVNDTIFLHYRDMRAYMQTQEYAIADIEVQFARKTYATALGVTLQDRLPTEAFLRALVDNNLIFGGPTKEWWERMAGDLAFRFASTIRLGLAQGETTSQIMKRLIKPADGSPGVFEKATAGTRALVQTSIATVAQKSRLEYFRQNPKVYKGVEQLSTLDGRTSEICIAYSGAKWDLEGKPIGKPALPFNGGPPRHWNCRSQLVGIVFTFREMGFDIDEPEIGLRASVDGAISADVTFDQFLRSKPIEFQEKLLGKQKAHWWRTGKLKLHQLVDQTGNPMTIDELIREYGFKRSF